ncbi:MAG: DUF4458 domain-containing protein [Alistipes sp.]|nr:DUF4458 domain-containing protein [Alistipes senegalensis]MCM1249878.1 DUF4458 domain-containing protein [Alistipes sp.]
MKLFRNTVIALLIGAAAVLPGGCSDDEGIDNRDRDYGYVQFKLYKDASYEASPAAQSRAVQTQLDYLSQASKVTVRLEYNGTTIAQTLTLTATNAEAAEYGLRSEKLQLLTGDYRVITFSLYDANDQPLYNGTPREAALSVTAGGLTSHDLTVNVVPRGKVRFTLVKDLSDFTQKPETRAANRIYTFDEIATIDITVQNKETNQRTTFDKLPMKFAVHFDENNAENGTPGYQTSSSTCDSLLWLPAGRYDIVAYTTTDADKNTLEINNRPKSAEFTVEDNRTTDAEAKITLYESDEYIKDYYALYRIWEALDGPNWYYSGENYPAGANWDFNKDPDLWGDQPGVQVHSNGRVARLDLSNFGFRGDMPEELGQLTALVELYLGTHNDTNLLEYDPTADTRMSSAERSRNRMENHKKYLSMIHPAPQMSGPCAHALREHGIHIPATALYDAGYSESEIFDAKGVQTSIRPMDTHYGKLCNGLRSLPSTIGNLKNLEQMNIANSEIESLPDEMAELTSCTDFELYNCPKMKQFPQVLARMPKLISLNISNNIQWSKEDPEGLKKGLEALGNGASKDELQLFYCCQNGVEEMPDSFRNLKKLGLLDMSQNKISKLPAGGLGEVAPTQLYLDNNEITEFPTTDGRFCMIEDMETFSASYNKLEEFPNIFSSKIKYVINSVNFAANRIAKFPDDFNGILVNTLTLSGNRFDAFPKTLLSETNSYVSYLIMRSCGMKEFPEDAFNGKYASSLASMDLTYNRLTELPDDFSADNLPYLYGVDLSYNAFDKFPYKPLNSSGLTIYAVRGQRNDKGERCLREWPTGIYQHTGLRGLYLGSNDLRKIDDTISYLIYYLDISDNPNITFDASAICNAWKAGSYFLTYDKTQKIINCDEMLK